jgi:hypothetical protein
MDVAKLIYRFPDQSRIDGQSEDEIQRLRRFLLEFCSSQLSNDAQELKTLIIASSDVVWFPDYGCALCSIVDVEVVRVFHVFLDKWESAVHACFVNEETIFEHDVRCEGDTRFVGNIPVEKKEQYFKLVSSQLSESLSQSGMRGTIRNAQKTPSFILSLARHCVEAIELDENSASTQAVHSHGGTTSVGGFTGSKARATSWPLLREVLIHFAQRTRDDSRNWFETHMLHFDLWFCRSEIARSTPDSISRAFINRIATVFACANERASILSAAGVDVSFALELNELRSRLDGLLDQQHVIRASELALKNLECVQASWNAAAINAAAIPLHEQAEGERLTNANLDSACYFSADTFIELENWITSSYSSNTAKLRSDSELLSVMRAIEGIVLAHAENFEPIAESEISAMSQVLEIYRRFAKKLLSVCTDSVLQIDCKATVALLHHIAWCVTHSSVVSMLSSPIGCPLDFTWIRHLFLSQPLMVRASVRVAHYMERQHAHKAAFSHDFEGTMQLARAAVRHETVGARARARAEQESSETERFANEWFAEVKQKQSHAAALRREIEEKKFRNGAGLTSEASDRVLKELERELRRTLMPPSIIVNPLPRDIEAASCVLFLLELPPPFEQLARLSFLCAELMFPEAHSFDHINAPSFNWRTHFNNSSRNENYAPKPVEFFENISVPDKPLVASVDRIHSVEQGVWHPELKAAQVLWKGTRSSYFDPRSGASAQIRRNFTGKFSSEFAKEFTSNDLDILELDSKMDTRKRANSVVCNQNKRPNWLNKPGFLQFAMLRSDPNMQLRQLLGMLSRDDVPLGNSDVRAMVCQIIYQLGDLRSLNEPLSETPKWKSDLFLAGGLKCFAEVLETRAGIMESKMRDRDAMPLLAEICSFMTGLSLGREEASDFKKVATKFGALASNWAKSLECDIEAANAEQKRELRMRQGLFHAYAILFHSEGEIDEGDVEHICKSMARVQYTEVFVEALNSAEFAQIVFKCKELLIRRTRAIAQVLSQSRRANELIGSVFRRIVATMPADLKWNLNQRDSLSFVARSTTGDWYGINLATGSVLVNGRPPGKLPIHIRNHPLFKRHFGQLDFEVVMQEGVLTTVSRFDGRFHYEFACDSSENPRLIVREIENLAESHSILELIDMSNQRSSIPTLLITQHSHWLSRERDVLVFRNIPFADREVSFLATNALTEQTIHRIGNYSTRIDGTLASWQELSGKLSTMNRLIEIEQNNVLQTLQRIEHVKFVHCWLTPAGNIEYELPRFSLSFELLKSKNQIASKNYSGFVLSQQQLLVDTLPFFENYVAIEHPHPQVGTPARQIIVPIGAIKRGMRVTIETSQAFKQDHCAFEFHARFSDLSARSEAHRLYLAAIYAATGLLLPERGSKVTGGVTAIRLVRSSWKGEPLNEREIGAIHAIKKFSELEPALYLLCDRLRSNANRLWFLYNTKASTTNVNPDAVDLYRGVCESGCNPRRWLNANEEIEIIGFQIKKKPVHSRASLLLPADLVPADLSEFLATAQREQSELVRVNYEREDVGAFPLQKDETNSLLARELYSELEESWTAYRDSKSTKLELVDNARGAASQILARIKQKRMDVEASLFKSLERSTSVEESIARASGLIGSPSPRDLLKTAFDPRWIVIANPFVDSIPGVLHSLCLCWLELCRMEDKLTRLCAKSIDSETLSYELSSAPNYSSAEYPQWLCFEVEKMIQIRPEQLRVAMGLIENPGSIEQLNMGLGKTRVILPMLMLHYSAKQLVRVFFYSPVFTESIEYLRQNLTASIFKMPLLCVPFNRSLNPTARNWAVLASAIGHCERQHGCVLMTTEHRASMELKMVESPAEIGSVIGNALRKLDEAKRIFDESDALLHHKFQLVYALGNCVALPFGRVRWICAEALARALVRSARLDALLHVVGVSVRVDEEKRRFGGFPMIRFTASIEQDHLIESINEAMLDELISDPPFELLWLSQLTEEKLKRVRRAILDSSVDASTLLVRSEFDDLAYNAILALRGLLAFGVFEHCIRQRSRVNFGIRNEGLKKLAVPFYASDTPSLRAEFAHPDVSIVLTMIAYYDRGLTQSELLRAITKLLSLNLSEQRYHYERWLRPLKEHNALGAIASIDDVCKVDTTNVAMMQLMWQTFRYSMAAIDFWLNAFVFPSDMVQFQQRTIASAWHLTDQNSIGFSGTNDNHRLMPLHVQQRKSGSKSLDGTNGKMLDMILKRSDHELVEIAADHTLWQGVLEFALQYDALIDAGGLLAGISNADAARFIVEKLEKHQGVLYFDSEEKSWFVMTSQVNYRHNYSPLPDSCCFALFDQSRCRGADLKLALDAKACMTIGPRASKDMVMQGAGRMRNLEAGQRLVLAGPKEVCDELKRLHGDVSAISVLEYVMRNTAEMNEKGLAEWVWQGFYFCRGDRMLDDDLQLEHMYQASLTKQAMSASFERLFGEWFGVRKPRDDLAAFVGQIKFVGEKYGSELEAMTVMQDQQCEREMQQEAEEEVESKREIARQTPRTEVKLDFVKLLAAPNAQQACAVIESDYVPAFSLSSFAKKYCNKMSQINWDAPIYLSENFANPLASPRNISEYLKPLGAMLVFKDASILLLSNFEAECVLELMWRREAGSSPFPLLVSFDLMRSNDCSVALALPKRMECFPISDRVLAVLRLFAGQTTFQQRDILAEILPTPQAKSEAESIVGARGLMHTYSHSDLQRFCRFMQ